MSKSLHEQIKELETELNPNEGDENERRNDESGETARSKRSRAAAEIDEAEDVGSESGRVRGRNGERIARRGRGNVGRNGKPLEEASSDENEASQGDGETSRGNRGRTSQDGGTPRSDARKPDGSTARDRKLLTDEDGEDEDEHNDPVAMARLRRENREMKARLRRAEEEQALRVAEPDAKPHGEAVRQPEAQPDPEPADKNSLQWAQWKIRQQDAKLSKIDVFTQEQEQKTQQDVVYSGAQREFTTLARQTAQKNPDFLPAVKHAFDRMCMDLHYDNPNLTPDQIVAQVERSLLIKCGSFAKRGVDPMAAVYDMAIERYGYRPGERTRRAAVQEDEQNELPDNNGRGLPPRQRQQPNLRVINNNRRRSATGLSGNGQGASARLNAEDVANMTLGEMANLDRDIWDQLENTR